MYTVKFVSGFILAVYIPIAYNQNSLPVKRNVKTDNFPSETFHVVMNVISVKDDTL